MQTLAKSKPKEPIPVARRRGRGRGWMVLCGLVMVALWSASAAHAADRLYWANFAGNTISWANLDGSAAGMVNTTGATLEGPMGMAIDSATGRIYWANYGGEFGQSIGWANLDNSGAGDVPIPMDDVIGPHGVAIDPQNGRIYWDNSTPPADTTVPSADEIWSAKLDGSDPEQLNTGPVTPDSPRSLALDLATGRLYYANHSVDGSNCASSTFGCTIAYANLDGSGGALVSTNGVMPENPEGVALDPPSGRLYWGQTSGGGQPDTISYTDLAGSDAGHLDPGAATMSQPHGIAIDPVARRIYWANHNAQILSWANLDGSGGQDIPTPGVTPDFPATPLLLETPAPTGAPKLSGGPAPGSALACTAGSWAPDMRESLLYRAPQTLSYQWIRNGQPIPGATASSLHATSVGDYRCQVTGQNAAGAASQASSTDGVFRIERPSLDRRNGTARLRVKVPGRGTLRLSGKGVVRQRAAPAVRSPVLERLVKGAGTVKLLIRPKGPARRRLGRTGAAKVKVRVAYTPNGGTRGSQTKTLKLRQGTRP